MNVFFLRVLCLLCGFFLTVSAGWGQDLAPLAPDAPPPQSEGFAVNLSVGEGSAGGDWSVAIQLVVVMTLLSLAPALLVMTTSFVRIVIVLGFVRQAMGTQNAPPNQVVIGLALFLTAFIMQPAWETIWTDAIEPLQQDEITAMVAWERGSLQLKDFMLRQTRPEDYAFVQGMQRVEPVEGETKFTVVTTAFLLSELRTAFQMGVLIYLPFLIIDFVVASILMSLGMMMMPPVMISLPCKLLLFVLVDGWRLIMEGLVRSFHLV